MKRMMNEMARSLAQPTGSPSASIGKSARNPARGIGSAARSRRRLRGGRCGGEILNQRLADVARGRRRSRRTRGPTCTRRSPTRTQAPCTRSSTARGAGSKMWSRLELPEGPPTAPSRARSGAGGFSLWYAAPRSPPRRSSSSRHGARDGPARHLQCPLSAAAALSPRRPRPPPPERERPVRSARGHRRQSVPIGGSRAVVLDQRGRGVR